MAIGNKQLALFRLKVSMLISQYVERRKVFIAENQLKGATIESLKLQKEKDQSRWTWDRDKLGKEIKREVAGLVNSTFMAAYLGGFKGKG